MDQTTEVSPVRVRVNTPQAGERTSLVMSVEFSCCPAHGDGVGKNRTRNRLAVLHTAAEKKLIQQRPRRKLTRHRFSGSLNVENRRENIPACGNQLLSSKNPSGGNANTRSNDQVTLCSMGSAAPSRNG